MLHHHYDESKFDPKPSLAPKGPHHHCVFAIIIVVAKEKAPPHFNFPEMRLVHFGEDGSSKFVGGGGDGFAADAMLGMTATMAPAKTTKTRLSVSPRDVERTISTRLETTMALPPNWI